MEEGTLKIEDPIHVAPSSDGFTMLPSGNFLINDGDGYNFITTYREYNGNTGQLVRTV